MGCRLFGFAGLCSLVFPVRRFGFCVAWDVFGVGYAGGLPWCFSLLWGWYNIRFCGLLGFIWLVWVVWVVLVLVVLVLVRFLGNLRVLGFGVGLRGWFVVVFLLVAV